MARKLINPFKVFFELWFYSYSVLFARQPDGEVWAGALGISAPLWVFIAVCTFETFKALGYECEWRLFENSILFLIVFCAGMVFTHYIVHKFYKRNDRGQKIISKYCKIPTWCTVLLSFVYTAIGCVTFHYSFKLFVWILHRVI